MASCFTEKACQEVSESMQRRQRASAPCKDDPKRRSPRSVEKVFWRSVRWIKSATKEDGGEDDMTFIYGNSQLV